MAVTITNSAGVPTQYIEYSLKQTLLALRNRTIFVPGGVGWGNEVFQLADVTGQGNGLSGVFGRYNALTASEVAEGAEYNGWQAFTPSVAAVTATRHAVGTIITHERLKKAKNAAQEWVNAGLALGRSAAAYVNKDFCSIFSSFSTGSGTSGSDATFAMARSAVQSLRTAGVEGQIIFVLHEQSWAEMLAESSSPLNTASVSRLADQAYMNYYVDDILGCRWFITADVQAATTVDWVGGVFNAEAIGVTWGEDFKLEVEWNKNAASYEMLLSWWHGIGIADQNCGRKHLTDY